MLVTVAAFAALCVVSIRRGIAVRGANVWLAVSFAAIATAGAAVPQLDRATTPGGHLLGLLLVGGGLVLHPVALVQFAHTLRPVGRGARSGIRVVAFLLLLAVAVIGITDPDAFADGEDASVAGQVVLGLVASVWVGVTVFVGVRLVRLGQRLTSSVGRHRARTLAGGVLGLGPAVAVPFLVPTLDESAGALFALVACGVTALGYVPPRWLRWAWSRRDTLQLTEVELAVLQDPAIDLAPWLDTVRRVWDADAVWFEVDDVLVGAVGDAGAPPSTDAVTRALASGVHVSRLDAGTWSLSAETGGARLVVRTDVDPVLIDDASDLFLATAGRLRSTATRRDLEARHRQDREAAFAAETSRLRDDVLSTLSHELRTPLVTLRGVPELLLSRFDALAPEDVRSLLERVHDNALSLHRMVEATMLLAQVRARELQPQPSEVPASEVLEGALARLRRVGVPVDRVMVGDASGLTLRTDARLSAAVLAELVHNALTYSEAPQPVAVWARWSDEDHVEVVVRDHGRGLAEPEQDQLRQAFSREGDVLTRDRRGLGVGLTLVNELAPMVGASLTLRTPDGDGTEVLLRLPAGRARPVGTAVAAPAGLG